MRRLILSGGERNLIRAEEGKADCLYPRIPLICYKHSA